MLEIALYGNDTSFLTAFTRELSARLADSAGEACRVTPHSIVQISLYDELGAPPDLCVVDVRDDPERGMEFIRRLHRGAGTEVMVLAPGPDWAMEAYDSDVTSYFLDPPDMDRIAATVVRRFSRRFRPEELQFSFRTAEGVRLLAAERIVYVEYADHRLVIHTDMGRKLTTTTMRASFGAATEQLLKDPRFVRTHASYLVNIMHVTRFEQYALTMDTGARVPVSHAKKPEVKRHFNRFFGGAAQ